MEIIIKEEDTQQEAQQRKDAIYEEKPISFMPSCISSQEQEITSIYPSDYGPMFNYSLCPILIDLHRLSQSSRVIFK